MGMFDSFHVSIICPYSNNGVAANDMEFQTKDFQCTLAVWRIGDVFDPDSPLKLMEGTIDLEGVCKCKACMDWEKHQIEHHNYKCHGHGRNITGTIVIRNGIVDRVKDVEKEE